MKLRITMFFALLVCSAALHAQPWSLLPWQYPIQNAGTTGTTANTLTATNSSGQAVIATAAATSGVIGVTTNNAGTAGTAIVSFGGPVLLVADGSVTSGHYVTNSASTNGSGTDGGATCPTSGQVFGVWTQTGSGVGTYAAFLDMSVCPPSVATAAFSAITAATNTAALLVGTGGSFGPTGTGTVSANRYGGAKLPRGFGANFTGTSVINGQVAYLPPIAFACTISAWNIETDATAATVKTWKIATGTAIPTVANVISTSGVSLSTGTAVHSTTVTDFTTTAVSANDMIAIVLSGISGSPTFLNFFAQCDQ